MRYAAFVTALFLLIPPASAAVTPEIDPRASLSVVQQWIYNYRAKPDYAHVPAAVRVLFHAQSFKEPENAGIYLGFIAGAIGSNPAKAEQLVNSLFPVAAGRRMGDRPRHRLFRIARLAQSAAPGRAEDAGTQGDDRQLSRRHAADLDRHPAGGDQARHVRQAARRVHAQSLRQGRQETEDGPDLRQQSGSAGYAVGILFRDRLASADPAHHVRCCPGARAATPSTS